jgi:hypothetical protein
VRGAKYFAALGVLAAAAAVLALGGALNPLREHRKTPIAIPLGDFPREIAGWVGTDQPLNEKELELIQPDDYVRRLYRRGDEAVWLYVVYHGNKLEGEKRIHHTATVCLPRAKGGWEERQDWGRTEGIVFPDVAKNVPVSSHYFVNREGHDWLVTVFFSIDGALFAAHRQPKKAPFERLYNRATERLSGPGYCIQVQVWTRPGGDPEAGYARAKSFLGDTIGAILRHFPARVEE